MERTNETPITNSIMLEMTTNLEMATELMETAEDAVEVITNGMVTMGLKPYDVIKERFFDFVKQASPDSFDKRSSAVGFGRDVNQLRLKSYVLGIGYKNILPWVIEYCSNRSNPNAAQLAACYYLLILKKLQDTKATTKRRIESECVVCYEPIRKGYQCQRCECSVVCETCYRALVGPASSSQDCVLCRYSGIYSKPLDSSVIKIITVGDAAAETVEPTVKPEEDKKELANLKLETLTLITEKMSFMSAQHTINFVCHAREYLEKIDGDTFADNRLTTLFESDYRLIPSGMSAGRMVKKIISKWLAKYVGEKAKTVDGLLQIYMQLKCNPLTGPFEMSLMDVMRRFHGHSPGHDIIYAMFSLKNKKKTDDEEDEGEKNEEDSAMMVINGDDNFFIAPVIKEEEPVDKNWDTFTRILTAMADKDFDEVIMLLTEYAVTTTLIWQKLFEIMCSSGYLKRDSIALLLDYVLVHLSPNQLLSAGGHLFKRGELKTWFRTGSIKYVELLVAALEKLPGAKWTKYWAAFKAMIPRLNADDPEFQARTVLLGALRNKLDKYAAALFRGHKILEDDNFLSLALGDVNNVLGIGHSGLIKLNEVQGLLRKPIDEHFFGATTGLSINYIRDKKKLEELVPTKQTAEREEEKEIVIVKRGSQKCVIVFIIDGTGSMGDGLKQCALMCTKLKTVFDKTNRAECQVFAGFVVYRDSSLGAGIEQRKSTCEYIIPCRELDNVTAILTNVEAKDGADWPEDLIMGLEIFRSEIGSVYENDASVKEKILIFCADAPGHGQTDYGGDSVPHGFPQDHPYSYYAEYCIKHDWKIMHITAESGGHKLPHPFEGHNKTAETTGATDDQLDDMCMQRISMSTFNPDTDELNQIFDAMNNVRNGLSGQITIDGKLNTVLQENRPRSRGVTMLESFSRQFSVHYETPGKRPRIIAFHSLYWTDRAQFLEWVETNYRDTFVILINYDQTALEGRHVINVINGMPSKSDIRKIMDAFIEWKRGGGGTN